MDEKKSGRVVAMFHVAKLFELAYGRAAIVCNAAGGFRATEIYPCNLLVFNDENFSLSAIHQQPH